MHIRRLFSLSLAAPPLAASLLCLHLGSSMAAVPAAKEAPPPAATQAAPAEPREAKSILEALDSVVRLKIKALAEARSSSTLGREREGSGVVLKDSGLVLTIGYLILEAESIEVTDASGKTVPGTVAGYDHATGFGLIRPSLPLAAKGVELGVSADAAEYDRMIFATYGGKESATLATVASKRRFAGYWEYLIDDAIFTVPPRGDHSGAALINRDGKLVGIGSLFVMDAVLPNRRSPGNMFVPVDLLKPIITDLAKNVDTRDAKRPWLGVSTQEVEGRLYVIRVQEEGPAARAGLKTGDIILAVQDEAVSSLETFYKKLWGLGQGGAAVPLKVLQGTQIRDIRVESMKRMDFVKAKPSL
jgi:S1-C subfamily serine protease